MSIELAQLVLTAILAVIAVVAALVAVKSARMRDSRASGRRKERGSTTTDLATSELVPIDRNPQPSPPAHIVQGRVIVTPTTRQVVDVTMGRPLVRLSVVSYGLAHALRPESRDRIVALMRREFRSRRRQRRLAAKRAARLANPAGRIGSRRAELMAESWLGELPPARDRARQGEASTE